MLQNDRRVSLLERHLQGLQSGRPLEAAPACLGASNFPQVAATDMFVGYETADEKQLRKMVGTAEFWISLLDGERRDLQEELAKHKRRHQLILKQADSQASQLRQAEGERQRLQKENERLRKSKDDAVLQFNVTREARKYSSDNAQSDKEALAGRSEKLEIDLTSEKEEKVALEGQLVRFKIKYIETLERVDTLESLIGHYEEQLSALDPSFEPADLEALGQWMPPPRPSYLDTSELESNFSLTESVTLQNATSGTLRLGHHARKMVRKLFKPGSRISVSGGPTNSGPETSEVPSEQCSRSGSPSRTADAVLGGGEVTPRLAGAADVPPGSPAVNSEASTPRPKAKWELRAEAARAEASRVKNDAALD